MEMSNYFMRCLVKHSETSVVIKSGGDGFSHAVDSAHFPHMLCRNGRGPRVIHQVDPDSKQLLFLFFLPLHTASQKPFQMPFLPSHSDPIVMAQQTLCQHSSHFLILLKDLAHFPVAS